MTWAFSTVQLPTILKGYLHPCVHVITSFQFYILFEKLFGNDNFVIHSVKLGHLNSNIDDQTFGFPHFNGPHI